MNLIGGELARDEHAFVSYANDRVTERLAMEDDSKQTPRNDMMHYMIHARDPITDRPFTRLDLDAESGRVDWRFLRLGRRRNGTRRI